MQSGEPLLFCGLQTEQNVDFTDHSPMESLGFCCPWYQTAAQATEPEPQRCRYVEPDLCRGGHPVHWRMFNSVPGFYPRDARNSSPVMKTKNTSRLCQMFPGGQKPPVENHKSRLEGCHFSEKRCECVLFLLTLHKWPVPLIYFSSRMFPRC